MMNETAPGYLRIVGAFEDIETLKKMVQDYANRGIRTVLVAYSDPKP